jgi:hypothetical protein
MSKPHIPDLAKIDATKNLEVKFYAMTGAIVSLSGMLEGRLFEIFQKGTQLPDVVASTIFFKVLNAAYRHDLAETAVKHRIAGNAALEVEWQRIRKTLSDVTSADGTRNLVAHNVVTRELKWEGLVVNFGDDDYIMGPPWPVGTMPLPGMGIPEFKITQDGTRVRSGARKAQEAQYAELLEHAKRLVALTSELDGFLAKL